MAAVEWVGPYRILNTLGAGAMGEVYLAEDPRLRRRVALKTLADSERGTPEAQQALLKEARAVARMSHPNVAAVYDVVESDGRIHIVMEYVRGETLAARVGRGPLTPASAVDIGIQLADALAEAHAMGIIHRDLKPSNVIVTPEGSAKVLDFGLARAVAMPLAVDQDASAPEDASDPRLFAGTPPYLPPERFLGRPADTLGDIYSLGVTLFEMLTGQRPYRGRDMSTIGVTALTEPTPRARAINPAVPDALDAIVARAMARNPQERFGSAVELSHALRSVQRLISEGPTESWHVRAPLLPQILSGSGRRSQWRRPFAWGALALVVVLPLYVISRQARRPGLARAQSSVVAVLPLLNASGDPANEHVGVGIADVLIAALAQVPGVTMISRSATLPYRERKQDLALIARELGADLVVDGAVQGSAQRIRVTLSLARPGSNEVVWTRAWDGALSDILSLQTQAAVALSDALQVTLTPEDRRRLERPPTDNTEALGDYVQARAFLDRYDAKGDLDRSIGLFESAIEKDPRFARARAGLGQAYWRKFEQTRDQSWSEKALLETVEALRLDAEDPSARETLAIIYQGTGRVEQAIEELRRAISFRPKSDEAHARLGQMLFDQGHREDGIAELKQAIALRPNYWGHYYALGVRYFDAGRHVEAAGAFRRVLELQPDSSRGLYMLGTVALATGDTAQAIEQLRKAIAVGAGHGAYTNLGHALYTQGRYEDAAKAYEEAARLTPKSPMKHRNLGDVYARLGQPAKTQQAYSRAVELCRNELKTNPRDARALSMMAVYEAKLGRRAEARRHADEAVALAPQMADVVFRRAAALALIGQAAESMAALEQALARGYSRKLASTDEDLAVLRGRPEFQALVGEASAIPTRGGPQ